MKYLSDEFDHYRQLEEFIGNGECGELLHQETNSQFHLPEVLESFEPLANAISKQLAINSEYKSLLPSTIPTRYDNPFAYKIVSDLVDHLKVTCQELGIQTDTFPPYSCIPTGVINAYAANVGSPPTRFLLFDSQVFFFCNLWAKIIATSQPIIGEGEYVQTSTDPVLVRKHLDANDASVLHLRELLEASLFGSPSDAPAYLPARLYIPQIDLLRDSMELFIVAHEFGHVYAGHLGPLLNAVSKTSSELISDANDSQKNEYEADSIALLLTLKTMQRRGFDLPLSYIGPYLFFSGLSLLDQYSDFKEGITTEHVSSGHPSNTDRQAMLNHVVAALAPDDEYKNAVHLQHSFSAVVEELLSRITR